MTDSFKIGIVYQIFYNNDPNIKYIGSTMQSLNKRWTYHKQDYNKYLIDNKKNASTIYTYFKQYDIKNFTIEEIKKYNVVDKIQLIMYEQLNINKFKPVNKINPFNILASVDKKNYAAKYREENKEKLKIYGHDRYKNNKEYFENYKEENGDKIKEYKKKHYQENKEKLAEKQKIYREENKEKVKESKKEHYEKNKERLLKQKNDYYHANKDEINKKVKEKITCDICNSQVARGNYSEHTRSKKHIKNLNKE